MLLSWLTYQWKLLISKRENGLITYSSWGVVDKPNEYKFLFTEDFQPKPAILKIREALDGESVDLVSWVLLPNVVSFYDVGVRPRRG